MKIYIQTKLVIWQPDTVGEHVKLISDAVDYCKFYDYPGLILLADFEKAFDTVKWTSLKAALKAFGFGPVFRCWITILYINIGSCVTNNDHLSKYFKLLRGIRQVVQSVRFFFF